MPLDAVTAERGGGDNGHSSSDSPGDAWDTSMPVIIAANRLPVRVTRRESTKIAVDGDDTTSAVHVEWDVEWAGDRVIEAQNTFSHHEISQRANVKFVGRISEFAIPLDEQRELALKLQEFNCYPVFVADHEAKLYYEDYCKQTLWPTFHNVVDVYSPVDVVLDAAVDEPSATDGSGDDDDKAKAETADLAAPVWNPNSQKLAWQAYANVNQLFAQVCTCACIMCVRGYVSRLLMITPSFYDDPVRKSASCTSRATSSGCRTTTCCSRRRTLSARCAARTLGSSCTCPSRHPKCSARSRRERRSCAACSTPTTSASTSLSASRTVIIMLCANTMSLTTLIVLM